MEGSITLWDSTHMLPLMLPENGFLHALKSATRAEGVFPQEGARLPWLLAGALKAPASRPAKLTGSYPKYLYHKHDFTFRCVHSCKTGKKTTFISVPVDCCSSYVFTKMFRSIFVLLVILASTYSERIYFFTDFFCKF